MNIYRNDTIVFYGDSITFHCHDKIYAGHLGGGYVNFVAARLNLILASPDLKIYNRGKSGDRIDGLESRLDHDVLPLGPTLMSILIGINDSTARFTGKISSPVQDFAAAYHRLLSRLSASGVREFILMEPFLLPVNDDQRRMRADLNLHIGAIRELALEFKATLVPLDGLFAEAATRTAAGYWIPDGVHPAATTGDALIAEAWMQRIRTWDSERPGSMLEDKR